ncbi:MAG: hypothetical protein IKT14_05830 [Clostridiales bacterium]|nr:hypothetical protein [Clostridiales bacterium]
MSNKKHPRRKIRLNIGILKRPFLLIAVTLAIIVIGLGIPKILLELQTRPGALPKGEVAIDQIQPYGADIIEIETAVIDSIDIEANIESHNEYTYLDTLLTNPPSDDVGYAANNYEELGLRDRSRRDLNDEFYYAAYSLIQEYFGCSLPTSVNIGKVTDPQDSSRYLILVTEGESNYALLDPSTGVPIYMDITFVGETAPDLDMFWSDLNDLYNDYLGITFLGNDDQYRYYERDGYDIWYDNGAQTTDEKLQSVVYATSGWYWESEDDINWYATDFFLWEIQFGLYEN